MVNLCQAAIIGDDDIVQNRDLYARKHALDLPFSQLTLDGWSQQSQGGRGDEATGDDRILLYQHGGSVVYRVTVGLIATFPATYPTIPGISRHIPLYGGQGSHPQLCL